MGDEETLIKNLSFKDFMEQVETHLKAFSPQDLQGLIMDWAKSTHPSKRNEFLSKLAVTPPNEKSEPDEELLEEIGELALRVERGEYCDGWGWDDAIHEERDWGDESWADEVDEFFGRAHEAVTAGYYKLAKDAYAQLFDILDMGEEPGHLPGSPDQQDLLDTDLGEARAEYLRSVYLTSPFQERPTELWRAMQRFSYHLGDELNLQSVVNIERKSLPDFAQFLFEWIELLKGTSDRKASYLLREAVILSGGTQAIARFAHDEGQRYPKAYVDWIKALEHDGDYLAMFDASRKGLASLPKDYVVRAEIAEGMVRAGEHLLDVESQLVGWHEAFYSDPSLSHLLSLLSVAEQKGRYKEEIEAAITRVALLPGKGGKSQSHSSIGNSEFQESSASESLLNQAYLLAGRHEDVFILCKKKGALGWSYGKNPKGLAIPFFLKLLIKEKSFNPVPNLEELWQESLRNLSDNSGNGPGLSIRFEQEIKNVIQTIHLSEEEENKYLHWCIEETGRRVDDIVGEKLRQSYYKAATLLVSLAEVMAIRGQKSKGTEKIEKYRQKYCHHSAFRKELDTAIERSIIR
jgi:hypothetical protein